MSDTDTDTGYSDAEDPLDAIPTWDDEYIEAVSHRLVYNYDLEKDYPVRGETFPLYGRMELHNQKHFLHPALSFAHHVSYEHLFVRRIERVTEADLDRYVALGHDLADDWIDADEEHFSTEFTFAVVTDGITDAVRQRVAGLDERTLLKFGYNGHYEINLVVVAPDDREVVANDAADVEQAFRTWQDIERPEPGLLGLIARRLQL